MTAPYVTPQTEEKVLAKALGVAALYLKREDMHPYGSHKGRSIPVMIDMKVAAGAKDFAISSSGNAALAAVRHIQKKNSEGLNLTLSILIGENINREKKLLLVNEIKDPRITLTESKRPLQALFEKIRGEKKESLRQSTDPLALIGYESLAEELATIQNLSAVFIGTSSGTTAEALAEYFNAKNMPVAVHIVQTTSCSPLASEFDSIKSDETSIADAIVDKVVYRRETLTDALKKGNGAGWIVSNEEIVLAQKSISGNAHIEVSPNGALGVAGLIKALSKGTKFEGSIACIITGK